MHTHANVRGLVRNASFRYVIIKVILIQPSPKQHSASVCTVGKWYNYDPEVLQDVGERMNASSFYANCMLLFSDYLSGKAMKNDEKSMGFYSWDQTLALALNNGLSFLIYVVRVLRYPQGKFQCTERLIKG